MAARNSASENNGWVDVRRGLVSRDIFVSDEIFQLEMERIFDRTWVFLAHETEILAAGDFVVRSLGSAPVIVVRDGDGTLHVLLNSCRHRGAKVCRPDSGNVRNFVCPYHGWTYEPSGRLMTTTFDRHVPNDFDFSVHGLVHVPRVQVHKAFIFGSWKADVVTLN